MNQISGAETDHELRLANEKTAWLDRFSEQVSEWVSPIVVKELRQTLKSHQFVWTFFLLLVAVMLWTLIGWTATASQPTANYDEVGPALLVGYFWILGFPLAIVIPFASYRSLSREFDDGTIQLISISTMRSWQIVMGKLVSSAVQILVYLSVLAPCISFTYLLRGISLFQITSGLGICIVGSFALVSLGLFLAAVARSRFFSIGISIGLVIGLAIIYFFWCILSTAVFSYSAGFAGNNLSGQFLLFGWAGFAGSSSLVLLAATSSLVSFESDNGSTLPRAMILVQQTVFLAWCFCMMTLSIDIEVLIVMIFILCHYWMLMGFAMVGESAQLSQRVQRSLPRSVGIRSLFSLFLPGPGRGLIYSVTNLWISGGLLLLIASNPLLYLPEVDRDAFGFIGGNIVMTPLGLNRAFEGLFVAFFYTTFFLSLMYLFMRWVANKTRWNWGPLASVLIGVVMITLLTIISTVLHVNLFPGSRNGGYSILLAGNWYWTTWEAAEPVSIWNNSQLSATAPLGSAALLSIAFAFFLASRELLTQPRSRPPRVAIDDQQIKEAKKGPVGETIEDIFNQPR